MTSYREFNAAFENDLHRFMDGCTFFAFSDRQFAEGMARLGLDADNPADRRKIRGIGAGGYILADRESRMDELFQKYYDRLRRMCMSNESFAYDAFRTELENHEYAVSMDPEPSLEALGFSYRDLADNPLLRKAYADAEEDVLRYDIMNSGNARPSKVSATRPKARAVASRSKSSKSRKTSGVVKSGSGKSATKKATAKRSPSTSKPKASTAKTTAKKRK